MKFQGKVFINGIIELKTGLHVGGSSTALDIGGIDSSVIKNAQGIPYIPGSSLKGKMRSLMELKYSKYTQRTGKVDSGMEKSNDGNMDIQKIFGSVAKEAEIKTRLIVRDSYMSQETLEEISKKENGEGKFAKLELDYTEGKWENTLNRLTSEANPRQLERVPAGAKFDFSLVFNLFGDDGDLLKMVIEALQLVEDDYLGGSGSRGYGQVKFLDIDIKHKDTAAYANGQSAREIGYFDSLKEISSDKLSNLIAKISGENNETN